MLDPKDRSETGSDTALGVIARTSRHPETPIDASWRDFIFAEIWSRPGLERRARYLIAMASAASSGGAVDLIDDYVRGALESGELAQEELREAALHLAVYTGWSRGVELDRAISRVIGSAGAATSAFAPIRAESWDPEVRTREGIDEFDKVMGFPGPPPVTPYFEAGIDNFVFGEMWKRTVLDQRSRRWITLVGVSESCATTPIKTHFYAAMASGNCTPEELQEFVLQYAVHGGWPKASVIQGAVIAMIKNYQAGLPWDA
jgi:4-carboxymuconolactone decarboxylase